MKKGAHYTHHAACTSKVWKAIKEEKEEENECETRDASQCSASTDTDTEGFGRREPLLEEWESKFFPTQQLENSLHPWRTPPSFLLNCLVEMLGEEFPVQVCVFWTAHANHLRLACGGLMSGDAIWSTGEFKHAKSLELHGCNDWIRGLDFSNSNLMAYSCWLKTDRAISQISSNFGNLRSLNLDEWSLRIPLPFRTLLKKLPMLTKLHVGMKQFSARKSIRARKPIRCEPMPGLDEFDDFFFLNCTSTSPLGPKLQVLSLSHFLLQSKHLDLFLKLPSLSTLKLSHCLLRFNKFPGLQLSCLKLDNCFQERAYKMREDQQMLLEHLTSLASLHLRSSTIQKIYVPALSLRPFSPSVLHVLISGDTFISSSTELSSLYPSAKVFKCTTCKPSHGSHKQLVDVGERFSHHHSSDFSDLGQEVCDRCLWRSKNIVYPREFPMR